MTDIQRAQLQQCKEYCDEEDKSTEFMLQYMQDVTGVDWWEMMDWLEAEADQ